MVRPGFLDADHVGVPLQEQRRRLCLFGHIAEQNIIRRIAVAFQIVFLCKRFKPVCRAALIAGRTRDGGKLAEQFQRAAGLPIFKHRTHIYLQQQKASACRAAFLLTL